MRNFDYHEKIFESLPNSYKRWIDEEKIFLRKEIKKDSKVLDVGCGDGRSMKDIIDITQNIIGIDIDNSAVLFAKKEFKEYPNINVLKANAKKMPFSDSCFDFVICMTSFVNFGEDKYNGLNEIKRVLKENGKIIMSVFNEDAFEERMNVYKDLNIPIKKIDGTKVIFDKSLGANVSEQFSKEQLINIFNNVNLKIIKINRAGIGYVFSAIKN